MPKPGGQIRRRGSIRSRRAAAWLVLVLGMTLGTWPAAASADEAPTYERDVKALFARRCNVCHSKKNLADLDVSAGLALDSYEAALAGTGEHKVIDAGNAAGSVLYERLNDPDEEQRMPLAEPPLSEAQRDVIRRWIDAGAPRGVQKLRAGAYWVAPCSSERLRA